MSKHEIDRDEGLVRTLLTSLGIHEPTRFAKVNGSRYLGVHPGVALRLDGNGSGIGPAHSAQLDALMSGPRSAARGKMRLVTKRVDTPNRSHDTMTLCVIGRHHVQARYYVAVSLLWPDAKWYAGETFMAALVGGVTVAIVMKVVDQ
jgi:hypothetical protein